MEGKLIIVSAPSGAGKTTLVKKLLDSDLNLEFSISACSRPKRPNETDGKDYYFLSAEEFKNKIKNGEFVEWEEVYTGQFYGTLHSELHRIWNKGKNVIFDVDVNGGINIKKKYGEKALSIFITPPSMDVLWERLIGRSTESEESIKKRFSKAQFEMSFAEKYDKQIVNEFKEVAFKEARELIINFMNDKRS